MESNGGPYFRANNHNNDNGPGSPDYGQAGGSHALNNDPRFYGDVQDPSQVLEALLPPLKQLDINQIPADLLAHLLKSRRIDQLVANNAGQRGFNAGGGDYPQSNQSYGQQGGPQYGNPAPRGQGSYSSNDWQGSNQGARPEQQQQYRQQHQQQWNRNQSVPSQHQQQQQRGRNMYDGRGMNRPPANMVPELSPLAKEFVPMVQNQYGANQGYDPNWTFDSDSIRGPKLEEMLNQLDLPDSSDFDANADRVLTTITDTINQLAVNPADFHRATRRTTEVLKKYLTDPDTLGVIVTLIFEQSVSNPNFCYSGARLCQEFLKNDIAVAVDNTRVSFKNMLIERCQQEFTSCLETMNIDPDMQLRAPGLLMFIAELYLNFQMEISGKSSKNMLFGLAAIELMTAMVSSKPVTADKVKCVFRTLKLIGWELDHDPRPEVNREMEKLIKELKSILSDPNTDSQTKSIVDTLFELRKNDWNKGGDWNDAAAPKPVSSVSESIYFELPDNVEEEDYSLLIDDEPEEVRRAYEEFLKSTGEAAEQ